MAMTVKICGLKTVEALEVALESGADLTGFVFFPPSPRNVSLAAAQRLGAQVKGRAGKVALTVNANDETLFNIVEALKPDMLQLHGSETPERVHVVRSRFGLPVMKALPIAQRSDLSPIRLYANVADRILFDARAPQEATRPGGLDVANVAQALAITHAPGVDVSSGIERAPGEKDLDKIRDFIRTARSAEHGRKALSGTA
jgi:phosphoribosylanthranilate isomerase